MTAVVITLGLALAGIGHALLNEWQRVVALWEAVDGRFPETMRTPADLAGPMLLTCGAVCALSPLLGG